MLCNYHFLSDEGKALSAGEGGEVMNWVKRQNKKPNKCLNKLSDDEEVSRAGTPHNRQGNFMRTGDGKLIQVDISVILCCVQDKKKRDADAASTGFKCIVSPNSEHC